VLHLLHRFSPAPDRLVRNRRCAPPGTSATTSLGIGLTALLGPTIAGFAIDSAGHSQTYLLLALFPVLPILLLRDFTRGCCRACAAGRETGQAKNDGSGENRAVAARAGDAGILETGSELANFLLPIFGHSIGLSASPDRHYPWAFTRRALLAVRVLMPILAKYSSEERVLSLSLFFSAIACLAFPFVNGFLTLLVMAFVLGLGLGCGGPLSLVLAYNRISRRTFG